MEPPPIITWLLITAATVSIALNLLTPSKYSISLTLFCISISLGIWHTDNARSFSDQLSPIKDGSKIELTGTISKAPEKRLDKINYTVEPDDSIGRILVSYYPHPAFEQGDRIKLKGEIKTPIEFPDFSYKEFLKKDKIFSVMYFPEVTLIEENRSFFLSSTSYVRDRLTLSTNRILPYPHSEILSAIILGQKQLLPENAKDIFNRVGVRHIAAISGMHISIIATLITVILIRGLRRKKTETFIISVFLLFFYIALIGFPPSAIRAGIMASMILLAEAARREYAAPRALVLAAGVMLIWNPLLLKLDTGFQLSFLAVLGILYITPIVEYYIRIILRNKLILITKLLSMTLGAQIGTLPITMSTFGSVSLIAPIANILVVPLVPAIIFSGFIAVASGILSVPLGIILSFPVFILIETIIVISTFLSLVPMSSITTSNISGLAIFILYCVLVVLTILLRKKLGITGSASFGIAGEATATLNVSTNQK